MTSDEQLMLWLEGRSIHNDNCCVDVVDNDGNVVERMELDGGECCPDFSCCRPELEWSQDMKQKFVNSSHEDRALMLITSLSALLANENVYVAGFEHE